MLVDIVQCPVLALEIVASVIACLQKSTPYVGKIFVCFIDAIVLHHHAYLANQRPDNSCLRDVIGYKDIAVSVILLHNAVKHYFSPALLYVCGLCMFFCRRVVRSAIFHYLRSVFFHYLGRNNIIIILPIIINIIINM